MAYRDNGNQLQVTFDLWDCYPSMPRDTSDNDRPQNAIQPPAAGSRLIYCAIPAHKPPINGPSLVTSSHTETGKTSMGNQQNAKWPVLPFQGSYCIVKLSALASSGDFFIVGCIIGEPHFQFHIRLENNNLPYWGPTFPLPWDIIPCRPGCISPHYFISSTHQIMSTVISWEGAGPGIGPNRVILEL